MLSKASSSSSVRDRNSPYPRVVGESASRDARSETAVIATTSRSSDGGYVRRSWSSYRGVQDERPSSSLIARNWTYPRGKDLITDEGRRQDFFTKNEIFFWKTLLEVFDGKHSLLSTDVIAQVKNKWNDLYAAHKRNKELESPPEDIFNLNLENLDLDQLFEKLEEIENRDEMEDDEPNFIKSGLPDGETLPSIEVCHESLKISVDQIRDETRQQFIDMLYKRNEAAQRKKREKHFKI